VAICRNCNASAAKVITTFTSGGIPLKDPRDRCEHCDDSLKVKATAPSDKKLYMGWEVEPNRYKKRDDGSFEASDEKLADQHDFVANAAAKAEDEAHERAKAQKRATRRTTPLTPDEIRKIEEKQLDKARRARAAEAGIWTP
jgi:hypothetical protein